MPPRTPDRFPGKRIEEELSLETNGAPDGGPGSVSYSGTSFVLVDSVGGYDPRTGGDNPLEKVMANSQTGDVYTSCIDGQIYLMQEGP
jgi:hypothetical protein